MYIITICTLNHYLYYQQIFFFVVFLSCFWFAFKCLKTRKLIYFSCHAWCMLLHTHTQDLDRLDNFDDEWWQSWNEEENEQKKKKNCMWKLIKKSRYWNENENLIDGNWCWFFLSLSLQLQLLYIVLHYIFWTVCSGLYINQFKYCMTT